MKSLFPVFVCLVGVVSFAFADDALEKAVEGTWSRKADFLGESYTTLKVLKDGNETVSVYDGDGKLYQQWTVEYKVQTTEGINVFTYQNGKDTFGKYAGGTFNVDEPASYAFRIKGDKWYEATGMFRQAPDSERAEVIVYERHHDSPSPAHKKLNEYVGGTLSYEGEVDASWKGTPWGDPIGKFRGQSKARAIMKGHFIHEEWEESYESNESFSGMTIFGYDSQTKEYYAENFWGNGTRSKSKIELNGNTMTQTFTQTSANGEESLVKGVWKYTDDKMEFVTKWELSLDGGKSWKPWLKYTGKRMK